MTLCQMTTLPETNHFRELTPLVDALSLEQMGGNNYGQGQGFCRSASRP
jgi:hypothetical protein